MTFFENKSEKQQLHYKKCSFGRAEDNKAGRMQSKSICTKSCWKSYLKRRQKVHWSWECILQNYQWFKKKKSFPNHFLFASNYKWRQFRVEINKWERSRCYRNWSLWHSLLTAVEWQEAETVKDSAFSLSDIWNSRKTHVEEEINVIVARNNGWMFTQEYVCWRRNHAHKIFLLFYITIINFPGH